MEGPLAGVVAHKPLFRKSLPAVSVHWVAVVTLVAMVPLKLLLLLLLLRLVEANSIVHYTHGGAWLVLRLTGGIVGCNCGVVIGNGAAVAPAIREVAAGG